MGNTSSLSEKLQETKMKPAWLVPASKAVASSDYLIILAGAGMGADSGLPTFRDKTGFWNAYPPAAEQGLSFHDCSNPKIFRTDERFGWGFFAHRYQLYSKAEPHLGYSILKKWADKKGKCFVFTSNVDGHFMRSGFSDKSVYECHGSIHYLQSQDPEEDGNLITKATTTNLPTLVFDEKFRAQGDLPTIVIDGRVCKARPNIMMFYDDTFVEDRILEQKYNFGLFQRSIPLDAKVCLIEIGAGNAVPTVRMTSEHLLSSFRNSNLLRINIDESEGPLGTISIPMGGKSALELIDNELS